MENSTQKSVYDLLIIGGGINGCGIANDASGRGLSVFLCEQFDLANETSSRSTKLIHGGLRYLEYYDFRLVREALQEREVLLQIAPYLVHPLQFIIPHNELQRPAWLIRLGLFLYDHLGLRWGQRSRIPGSRGVRFTANSSYTKPLKSVLKKGFSYYDCRTDDSRLVVLNALAAQQRGATIKTRHQFLNAERINGIWHSRIQNTHTQEIFTVTSKALINAAGPWVDVVDSQRIKVQTEHKIDLVQGSHIVVPKLYEGEHAYMLQNPDKRIVFVIPYLEQFTMIGTTDLRYQGDPAQVAVTDAERIYLCDSVNRYFKQAIKPSDIVYEWSGVRPLKADDANNPSAVTRDYSLELEDAQGAAPLLSIFGGKITTYRELAEHALAKLMLYFPTMGGAWTATTPLPGGDIKSPTGLLSQLTQDYPFLPPNLLTRYVNSYGSRVKLILANVRQLTDLGRDFGGTLYAKEVDYLVQYEWAQTADDILWRRSKLGLFKAIQIPLLQNYLLTLHPLEQEV